MTTASTHNHQACIDRALQAAEQLCESRGLRLTPIRRTVLELIWQSHKSTKAYELLEQIRPYEFAAKPPTVYRALEFLLENGLIHRVESLNAFVGCVCSSIQHEQVLLICKRCQDVEERPALEVMQALLCEIEKAGFQVRHKAIEVHGICAGCLSLSTENTAQSDA